MQGVLRSDTVIYSRGDGLREGIHFIAAFVNVHSLRCLHGEPNLRAPLRKPSFQSLYHRRRAAENVEVTVPVLQGYTWFGTPESLGGVSFCGYGYVRVLLQSNNHFGYNSNSTMRGWSRTVATGGLEDEQGVHIPFLRNSRTSVDVNHRRS